MMKRHDARLMCMDWKTVWHLLSSRTAALSNLDPFLLDLSERLSALRRMMPTPTGTQVLIEMLASDRDLEPLIRALECAAVVLPEATGSWGLNIVSELVYLLDNTVYWAVEATTLLVEGSDRYVQGSGRARSGKATRIRWANKIREAEGRLGVWQKRLRSLGKRILLEHLPKAEARDAALHVR